MIWRRNFIKKKKKTFLRIEYLPEYKLYCVTVGTVIVKCASEKLLYKSAAVYPNFENKKYTVAEDRSLLYNYPTD